MSKDLTEADRQFSHIIYEHVLRGWQEFTYAMLESELTSEQLEDSRFSDLVVQLANLLDTIEEFAHGQIDLIPGTISREEAEELFNEQVKKLALLDGFPEDTYLAKKLPLQ